MTELPRDLPDDAAAPPQHRTPPVFVGSSSTAGEPARLTAWVRGRVQGVGFRWWTHARALELSLAGWARNLEDGRVEVVAQGPRSACEALLALLCGDQTPGRVVGVTRRWSDPRPGLDGFLER